MAGWEMPFASHFGAKLLELAIHDVGGFVQNVSARRSRHCRKREHEGHGGSSEEEKWGHRDFGSEKNHE